MQENSDTYVQTLADIALRNRLSLSAVQTLAMAIRAGNGAFAQFNHPDLGGMGQWSQGGMIMLGDMFNNGLKARVSAACEEIAHLNIRFEEELHSLSGRKSSQRWWPGNLGTPSASGGQNTLRYAFFPMARRLAIMTQGILREGPQEITPKENTWETSQEISPSEIKIYDTGNLIISGFAQQQSATKSITLTSQHGPVPLRDLPVVSSGSIDESATATIAGSGAQRQVTEVQPTPVNAHLIDPVKSDQHDDPLAKLERLAELHRKGVLTDKEFAAKKSELLARI